MPLVLLPMIKRIIDVSEAAYVRLKHQQLAQPSRLGLSSLFFVFHEYPRLAGLF